MSDTIRYINPPQIAASPNYTHVVETSARRTIHISGQVALDRDGNLVGQGDMAAQAVQVFENLKAALESVGATFDDVLKINTYMVDIAQMPAVREVRRRYFTGNPPASTAVEVSRLVMPGLLIEIDAVAVLND